MNHSHHQCAKPRLQKEGRPTWGIHMNLQNICLGREGWGCSQPAPVPWESSWPHPRVPVPWRREADTFTQWYLRYLLGDLESI